MIYVIPSIVVFYFTATFIFLFFSKRNIRKILPQGWKIDSFKMENFYPWAIFIRIKVHNDISDYYEIYQINEVYQFDKKCNIIDFELKRLLSKILERDRILDTNIKVKQFNRNKILTDLFDRQ